MTNTSRLNGLVSSAAVKIAVHCATLVNITLYGTQTIDGIVVSVGDRVLVKNQTDQTQNGIYLVSDTAWQRTTDFNSTRDIAQGTLVFINLGSSLGGQFWKVDNQDDIEIGVNNITFSVVSFPTISILDKTDGTIPPTSSNDSTEGYSQKSKWFDQIADEVYICIDSSVGAAVWLKTTLTIDELGSMALQDSTSVSITGGNVSGLSSLSTTGISYPVIDGASGQVLSTNGAGVLEFTTLASSSENRVRSETTARSTFSSLVALDNTIPQISEGQEVLTASITPTSSSNSIRIKVHHDSSGSSGGSSHVTSIYRDAVSDAIVCSSFNAPANGYVVPTTIDYIDSPATTSEVAYSVRVGTNTGNTYFNGSSIDLYGGARIAYIELIEIIN